jgi:hypothetical protein
MCIRSFLIVPLSFLALVGCQSSRVATQDAPAAGEPTLTLVDASGTSKVYTKVVPGTIRIEANGDMLVMSSEGQRTIKAAELTIVNADGTTKAIISKDGKVSLQGAHGDSIQTSPSSTQPTPLSQSSNQTNRLLDRRAEVILFDKQPLDAVLASFKQHGIPISPTWNEIREVGIEPSVPVSANLTDVSYRTALRLILQSVSKDADPIGFVVGDDGTVFVLPADGNRIVTRVYDVRDLVGWNHKDEASRLAAVENVINLITQLVAPDSWTEGQEIRELNGSLVVQQRIDRHQEVQELISKLKAYLEHTRL